MDNLTTENIENIEVITPEAEEATGLPWLKTWRATYLFTLGSFVTWVVLLFVLTEWLS